MKDIKYVAEVKSEIKNVIEEYSVRNNSANVDVECINPGVELVVQDKLFLDFLLMKIRTKTISYATLQNKNRREKEDKLAHEIDAIERKTHKTDEDLRTLKYKSEELVSIRNRNMEGVLLRSRARWVAEGEKITKYFCNLEKRNYISKRITKLEQTDGQITYDQEKIKAEVNNFYSNLYKKSRRIERCEISELVHEVPQLSLEERNLLEGEITIEEAGYALKQMSNGKSPGTDGFGAEFFKFFWKQLGPFVVRALNESFRDRELSTTQKEGLITCIPKGEKPKEFIQNWRPISLLNVVYKIGSSCIANRIKTVLPKLINEDQTGFMKNRFMGDNLRLIYDLMHYLDLHKLPGILLCLDFEKAFDSVDWNFMVKVLKAYGFGDEICGWIETFYKNIKSSVIVNGQSTKWFEIERGCRQGDPVSPYLFILVVEIMAIMIRENPNIKGVCINGTEHKISQFADDTQLFNKGDKTSFENSIHVISKFGNVSGLFLNNGKTQAIWLGSKKHSSEKHMSNLNFAWNPKYFKILGVWFTTDLHEIETKNYTEKMSEVQILFNIWSKRIITPIGRIAVLKSLILSKLVYLWMLLPNPPDQLISRLQLLCFKFVWNNKQDRLSRKISVKNIKHGGMGIPDIRKYISALKLTWIRKLLNTSHKWKNICINLYPFLDNLNKYGSYIVKTMKHNLFWIHVLEAHKQISCEIKPRTSSELLAEPVLFNENILIGGVCIKNLFWINHGVYCIGHFYNSDGSFLTFTEFKEKYNLNIDFITYNGCKHQYLNS